MGMMIQYLNMTITIRNQKPSKVLLVKYNVTAQCAPFSLSIYCFWLLEILKETDMMKLQRNEMLKRQHNRSHTSTFDSW